MYYQLLLLIVSRSLSTSIISLLLSSMLGQYNIDIFLCVNRNVTRTMSKYSSMVSSTGDSNVWLYDFNHVASFPEVWSPSTQCYNAVCHAAELPFVFNSFEPFVNYTNDEAILGANMLTYWTNFAHTGTPSPSSTPWNKYVAKTPVIWSPYETTRSQSISFETPVSKIESFFLQKYCDFWDTQGNSPSVIILPVG
jgi:carboxylesterase type B